MLVLVMVMVMVLVLVQYCDDVVVVVACSSNVRILAKTLNFHILLRQSSHLLRQHKLESCQDLVPL